MFCPNCGTQNDDSAAACQKCAFNLKGASAPKFKGTMLMVNAPPTVPRPVPAGATASAKPPAAGPFVPAASSAPRPPGALQKAPMKATMIGVAPPSPGAVAPPMPAPVPVFPAPAPAPVMPPAAVQPPPDPAFPATGPMGRRSPDAVNPLGGTMVATPGVMEQALAARPAMPDAGQIAPQAPQAVSPAAAAGGWGPAQPPPASPGPYAPYAAPQSPYAAPPSGMQAMGAPGAGYASPVAVGQHGPIGKMRNPVTVVVLTYVTCGIYGMIALLTMLGELKTFRQKNDIAPILFLLPVIGLLEMIKLPAKVLDAKRMAGVPNAQEPNVILYLFLGIYMLPADLNEIWQVAAAKQSYGALPPGAM